MADTQVPQVAKIHLDDLAGLFRLKLSFLLETPAGNFEKELVFTAADLVTVIADLITAWTGGGAFPVDVRPSYLGDPKALRNYLENRFNLSPSS